MRSYRLSRCMLCLYALILFLLPCAGLSAEFSIGTNTYLFLTGQSTVVQTGGFAGVHETYPIQGQFQLTVDANVGVASFDTVDANLLNPTGFLSTESLGELFNMTELQGTVVGETLIEFRGKTADDTNTDVSLKLTLTDDDGTVQLTGQTIPPANSADYFVFNMDAVAQKKYSGGTGEPNDPHQIATAADLILLGETPDDYDKHFVLTADIDLDPNLPGGKVFDRAVIAPDVNDTDDWHFQGTPFTGVFDGGGHKISHLAIEGGSCCTGLFGYLYSEAEIRNLHLIEVDIRGSFSTGAIAGMNEATITNCCTTGIINGGHWVGGVVGLNVGRIVDCHNTAGVSGDSCVGGLSGSNSGDIGTSYSTGSVSGYYAVGGLVGGNSNWSASGKVTNCYSTGTIWGTEDVGGLVGSNFFGSIVTS